MAKAKFNRSTYSEKLRDPRWQKLRLEVFQRDGWACQRCGDTETTLSVHHKYYEKGKEPWEYPIEVLITLCEQCHSYEYDLRGGYEQSLLYALRRQGFLAEDVSNIAIGLYTMPMIHLPEVMATCLEWALGDLETVTIIMERYFAHLQDLARKKGPDSIENDE